MLSTILFGKKDDDIQSLLHPTDLSEASLVAFHHALAIAIRRGAEFTLLHALGRRDTDSWVEFPKVRDTLGRWRGFATTASIEENIGRCSVSKIESPIPDPVAACTDHVEKHSVDMIVIATEVRSGLSRLVRASRAQRLAREARLLTLFIPAGGRPFVNGETGAVSLSRILVPIDPATDPRPAMLQAVRSAALLDDPSLEITLLHVADGDETPTMEIPELPYCRWNVLQQRGDVVDRILGVADDVSADAIYMSTAWQRPGLARRGSGVTEAVLDRAACPVMAVPVG